MMKLSTLRKFCLSLPGAVEDFPFGEGTLVVKVGGKMFALIALDADPLRINLKCDPLLARTYREQYPSIIPGYHMNKDHWNTVCFDGSLKDAFIRQMIVHSHTLVVESLPKTQQARLLRNALPEA
jgi:predicted DNA-binding protein (MmcQ/YjbR family)